MQKEEPTKETKKTNINNNFETTTKDPASSLKEINKLNNGITKFNNSPDGYENNNTSKNSDNNIFNKIETKIFKTLITLALILLLLLWSAVPIIILTVLGINYDNLSFLAKAIILLTNDIILLAILIFIYRKSFFKDLQNFWTDNLKGNLKTAISYWLVGMFIMILSNQVIAIITNGQLAGNEEAVRELIDQAPWYMAFQLIIYAPITEELIFRRSIKDITWNKYLYCLISGLVFGGLHVATDFKSLIDLIYLIPYCSLGFVFALLYRKTNNIFSTITVHAIHNSLALIIYLI